MGCQTALTSKSSFWEELGTVGEGYVDPGCRKARIRLTSMCMQALFIGQTYIDIIFLTDCLPTGDDRGVLLREAFHRP